MAHIVIVGNGIAGTTAAIKIRSLSQDDITMISDETAFPYARTALMYVGMGQLLTEDIKLYPDWFWQKNNIQLIQRKVKSIDTTSQVVCLSDHQSLRYDKLILATGSSPRTFDFMQGNTNGVHFFYGVQDLEKIEKCITRDTKKAIVVGGGLTGVEVAEMLKYKNIDVTILIREPSYGASFLPNEESIMVHRHLEHQGITIMSSAELIGIHSKDGQLQSIKIKDDDQNLVCDILVVTIGVHPNIQLVKDTTIAVRSGILVDEYLQTSVPNVYAIGDCAEIRNHVEGRKSIEPNWYIAKIMGETIAQTICGNPIRYQQTFWSNAAKYFEISYQSYGYTPAIIPENIYTFHWKHPILDKSIRIFYSKNTEIVLGFCVMGIRFRQAVCQQWIENGSDIREVISHLYLANFDPEFSHTYQKDIMQYWLSQPQNLSQQAKFFEPTP